MVKFKQEGLNQRHGGNQMTNHGKISILGVGINPIRMEDALETLHAWWRAGKSNYVCVTPAHSIMDAFKDQEFRHILNASGMTTPDGMSVVWILRTMGFKGVERVYGSELMLRVCSYGLGCGWRHFFYGGAPGVSETLVERLVERFPGLRVAGTYTPPFGPLSHEEDAAVIRKINESNVDIVWVGLSSPKQERWMADHLARLQCTTMIGVGAAFDFVSGTKPQAPHWIQNAGFEWLFRLATEPRRLWPRYRQYPLYIWLVLLQLLGLKKFPAG